MASESESRRKMNEWANKTNPQIRGMLVRAEGKHRELCLEAERRIDGLSKQIDQIRLIAALDRSSAEKVAHIMAKIDGVVGG